MKKTIQRRITHIEGPVDTRECPVHGREQAYVLYGDEVEVYEPEGEASTASSVGWSPLYDQNWLETFGVCDVDPTPDKDKN